MLKLRNNLLLIIGLFSGFVQASELSEQLLGLVRLEVEKIAEVQELIAAGVDVNQAASDGFTPLMFANVYGSTQVIRILLDAGADVNQATTAGATALTCAIGFGYNSAREYSAIEMVHLLLGANINLDHCQKELVRLKSSPYYSDDSDNYYKKIVDILEGHVRWHGLRSAWIGAVHLASNDHLDDPSASSQRRRIE